MTKKKENQEIEGVKKSIRSWSSGLSVLCLILRILEYIGIVAIGFTLIFVPVLTKNIKIEENQIEVFGKKIEYQVNNVDLVEFNVDGKEYKLNNKDIFAIFKEVDVKGIGNIIYIACIIGIATIIVSIIMLKKAGGLLKQMSNEERVFVKDGNLVIHKIMILLIVEYAITIVGGIIIAIALKTKAQINLNLSYIIPILGLYFIKLVYKYGEHLEEK